MSPCFAECKVSHGHHSWHRNAPVPRVLCLWRGSGGRRRKPYGFFFVPGSVPGSVGSAFDLASLLGRREIQAGGSLAGNDSMLASSSISSISCNLSAVGVASFGFVGFTSISWEVINPNRSIAQRADPAACRKKRYSHIDFGFLFMVFLRAALRVLQATAAPHNLL